MQTRETHTSKTNIILFALMMMICFEAFLLLFGRINSQNYAVFNNSLSGYCLYFVNLMAHLHTILSIVSVLNRHPSTNSIAKLY